MDLARKFEQEAVLIKTIVGTKLYYTVGNVVSLGNIQPGKLGQIYSQLRNNKKSNTFVFEQEREQISWIARLAGITNQRKESK